MKLNTLIQFYIKKFNKVGLNNPLNEIRCLIKEKINLPLLKQITEDNIILKNKEEIKLKNILNRRLKREPVDRILNKKEFRAINLNLNKYTFSPRPETEILLDIIVKNKIAPKKILELGTGSGAISIALLKEFPNSKVIATDINIKAIELAKKNAIKNKVIDQISFICCNWLDSFVNSDFDLIVSNPPYIKTEVIKDLDPEVKYHDPLIALDGGKDGLVAYNKIIAALKPLLISDTIILFEIGYDQGEKVSKLMRESKIMYVKVFEDYSKKPRFVLGTNKKNLISY
jgi:release factor glutamine methyltransferase